MASAVATYLLNNHMVDFVFCFSPSNAVSRSFKQELERQTQSLFDGALGSVGASYTYHKMLSLPRSIWQLFETKRVFVILDEIHHCCGQFEQQANSWGNQLLKQVKDKALYTLALSGTPWRSDRLPMTLTEYCNDGSLVHGYLYSLMRAISESVCRIPKIVILNSDNVTIKSGGSTETFTSLTEAIRSAPTVYRDLIHNTSVCHSLIDSGVEKLKNLRKEFAGAGGLVVAASVGIQRYLSDKHRIKAHIVTYLQPNAQEQIDQFRQSQDPWIVSVGMISEGTDIPRLMVCCYLSLIRTEMYFRQVLGRILRKTSQKTEHSYFYMLADPRLTQFAESLQQEIPTENLIAEVTATKMQIENPFQKSNRELTHDGLSRSIDLQRHKETDHIAIDGFDETLTPKTDKQSISYTFGEFKHQLLDLVLEQ
jgi:superfamily II DNA or RNA helicase